MSKKVRYYSLAFGICFLLLMLILTLKNANSVYAFLLGDVQSLYEQADSLYRIKKYDDAAKLYSKLARVDSAKYSQFVIGDIYYQGKTGVVDYEKAIDYFTKSADKGCADAQNNLGYIYAYGIGADINYSKAKRYLSMAVAQGHSQAQVGLASLYRHGWGVTRSYAEAFRLYQRAAAHDNTDAMNNLGYMYTFGYGTATSVEDAIYWFEK